MSELRRVAALFVQAHGSYKGVEGVDMWDLKRDATTYAGSDPVVAHPPCERWCRLAGLVQARWGHKIGDDGGTFSSALASVRRVGGVLEHPAYSKAWPAHGLAKPPTGGEWVQADEYGWTCYVEQWRYGHQAKKATWLYACRVLLADLHWGIRPDSKGLGLVERYGKRTPVALVSYCGNNVACGEVRPRLTKKAAAGTPPEFRDVLLKMARTART